MAQLEHAALAVAVANLQSARRRSRAITRPTSARRFGCAIWPRLSP